MMEVEAFKRTEISQDFTGVLNEMLKGSKHHKSTQVMDHDLQWDSENASNPVRFKNMNLGAENFTELGIKIDDQNLESQMLLQGDNLTLANFGKRKPTGEIEEMPEPLETDANALQGLESSADHKERAYQLELGLLQNFMWAIPCSIKVFMKNVAAQKDTAKVLPWHVLRKEIESFYSYVSLASKNMVARVAMTTSFEEYLCMYLLDVVLSHRRGTR